MGEHVASRTETTKTPASANAELTSLSARDAMPDRHFEDRLYTDCLQRLPIQRKLSVGAVDDPMEKEADHMADRVMRMPSFIQKKELERGPGGGLGPNNIQRFSNGLIVQKQDHNRPLNLPQVPNYHLQIPSQSPLSGNASATGHLQPGFNLHTNNTLFPAPRYLLGRLWRPLFQYLPSLRLRLSLFEMQRILGHGSRINPPPRPHPDPPPRRQPDIPVPLSYVPPAREPTNGLRLGVDQFRDIITGNRQVSAVARGLDGGHLRLFNRVWDLFHEPTVTFSAGTPGEGTDNSTQFGLGVISIHLSNDIEFAPLQVGVDTQGGVAIGSQVEFHSPDPHWSTYLNFGYNLTPDPRDPGGHYIFSSTGISISFFPHVLNP
ncbi:hypothetical protein ACX0G9_00105 [Flavitalea flava]